MFAGLCVKRSEAGWPVGGCSPSYAAWVSVGGSLSLRGLIHVSLSVFLRSVSLKMSLCVWQAENISDLLVHVSSIFSLREW